MILSSKEEYDIHCGQQMMFIVTYSLIFQHLQYSLEKTVNSKKSQSIMSNSSILKKRLFGKVSDSKCWPEPSLAGRGTSLAAWFDGTGHLDIPH